MRSFILLQCKVRQVGDISLTYLFQHWHIISINFQNKASMPIVHESGQEEFMLNGMDI